MIDRLDGLEPSGFALAELEPGINIVYGPNASGKTSLCGAIRQLLAPGSRPTAFAGRSSAGPCKWTSNRSSSILIWVTSASNGVPMARECPFWCPKEFATVTSSPCTTFSRGTPPIWRRNSSNKRRAASICVPREALKFRSQVSTRGSGVYQALKAAQKRVETVRAEQQQLVEEERRLADLEIEYSQTRQAGVRVRLLERAVAWNAARRALDERADDLSQFPVAMANLCGDEMERLRRFPRKAHRDLQPERAEHDQPAGRFRSAGEDRIPLKPSGRAVNRRLCGRSASACGR